MIIRAEKPSDYEEVYNLIKEAFQDEEHTDHKEQDLVCKLRKSDNFIPELSLVAEKDGQILGHILFTTILVNDETLLALAPVAVLNANKKTGIGSALINEGHKIAEQLGHKGIVVLGHEQYYPRFGYSISEKYGITPHFDVPKENFMVKELYKDALLGINGVVVYAKEFLD